MISTIYIIAEVIKDADINQVAEDAITLVNKINCLVQLKFDHFCITVGKDTTVGQIICEYLYYTKLHEVKE